MPVFSQNTPTFAALYTKTQEEVANRLSWIKTAFNRRNEWTIGASPDTRPDLITSHLTLQHASDIAMELHTIHHSLADGGLFLGAVIGGQSFYELRNCLMEAEIALSGGGHPRMNPLPDTASLSRFMTTAGFALPVVDSTRVTLVFDDLYALTQEIRLLKCTNKHQERARGFTCRDLFSKASELYTLLYPSPAGGVVASVDIIHLHGWHHQNCRKK